MNASNFPIIKSFHSQEVCKNWLASSLWYHSTYSISDFFSLSLFLSIIALFFQTDIYEISASSFPSACTPSSPLFGQPSISYYSFSQRFLCVAISKRNKNIFPRSYMVMNCGSKAQRMTKRSIKRNSKGIPCFFFARLMIFTIVCSDERIVKEIFFIIGATE